MSRNIVEVINKLIPLFQKQNFSTTVLYRLKSSAEFLVLPEHTGDYWGQLQLEINRVLNDFTASEESLKTAPSWVLEMAAVVSGCTVQHICHQLKIKVPVEFESLDNDSFELQEPPDFKVGKDGKVTLYYFFSDVLDNHEFDRYHERVSEADQSNDWEGGEITLTVKTPLSDVLNRFLDIYETSEGLSQEAKPTVDAIRRELAGLIEQIDALKYASN